MGNDWTPTRNRYNYFIHASADVISSYSIDFATRGHPDEGHNDWEYGENNLHVVSPDLVISEVERMERKAAEMDGMDEINPVDEEDMYFVEEVPIAENEDFNKKVRGPTFSDLYVKLMSSFDYF